MITPEQLFEIERVARAALEKEKEYNFTASLGCDAMDAFGYDIGLHIDKNDPEAVIAMVEEIRRLNRLLYPEDSGELSLHTWVDRVARRDAQIVRLRSEREAASVACNKLRKWHDAEIQEGDRLRAENKDLTTQLLRLREVVDICEEGSVRSMVVEVDRLRAGLEEMAANAAAITDDEYDCAWVVEKARDLLGKPSDWRPADEDKG